MPGECRTPPLQLGHRLWRMTAGRAGGWGILAQLLLLLVVVWLGYEITSNAQANLKAQRIAAGLGFLNNTAGFGVSQSLIAYDESDTYLRVFAVGLLNTLLVSFIGCVLATIIGFMVGLGRLSPNWLVARLAGGYVELIRNLPLLFQILFWYLAVLGTLPGARGSISVFGVAFLNNRGVVVPRPVPLDGFAPFVVAIGLALAVTVAMKILARRRLYQTGKPLRVWPWALGLLVGLPAASAVLGGAPFSFEQPELRGFNFVGGTRLVPELIALVLALSTYTAAFIAEIVRAGIQAVPKGQIEAASALGLRRGAALRLIVVPQSLRVILPPLTNQYLNLTKNSSLAVAIGYPDLVSVFAGTTLSQTGQAIEIIAITMGVYLLISLATSAGMNLYNYYLFRNRSA
ncbi:MAG: ABC transporter permease subunit [Xanthobacteraceae bacterium]|nr:MAG: ABC transporter permease subunit [Xanthobacteraceae bacterium]